MRLWSIHPAYLDPAGLTACWREGLLARKVLLNQTTGYRNHPQLARFRHCTNPSAAIDTYLHGICDEAHRRGYRFDRNKLGTDDPALQITVTDGQLAYELEHLRHKLLRRSPETALLLPGAEPDGETGTTERCRPGTGKTDYHPTAPSVFGHIGTCRTLGEDQINGNSQSAPSPAAQTSFTDHKIQIRQRSAGIDFTCVCMPTARCRYGV